MDEKFILDDDVHFVDKAIRSVRGNTKLTPELHATLRMFASLAILFYAYDAITGNHFWVMAKNSAKEFLHTHIPHF